MLRLLIICLFLVAMLGGALAWSMGGDADSPADFTFTSRADHKTLDPGVMSWNQDIRLGYSLWEGLYRLDPATLNTIPGVAEKIDIDSTLTQYTFHLRPAARWSNGDLVTAGDFAFAWRRLLEQPSEYTAFCYYIRGAEQYQNDYAAWVQQADAGERPTTQPAPDFANVGIKVLDARTLQINLRNPTPFFPDLCAFPSLSPEHEPSMRPFATIDPKTGRVSSYDEGFTRPPYLVSNGPYRLDEWIFKRKLRLVASDYYWDKASVRSRVIDEPVIEDPMAAFRAYLSGRIDWVADVDESLVGEIRQSNKDLGLHLFPAFGTYYYVLNCLPKLQDGSPNPLADARVRRALAMSVDRRPIIENVTKGGQPAAADYLPPGVFPHYTSPPGLPYDVPEARRLLAEAGYPDGRGFPTLHISYNQEFTQHADIALILRSQWQTNLGINLDLSPLEIKVFGVRLFNRQLEIARASWFGDYLDPTTFTDKFKSDDEDNNAGWANPQYDALCAAAEKETNPIQRLDTLSKAEGVLLRDAPIIPLYYYVNAYLFRPNVSGIPLDPREMVMLKSVGKSR
jgi:oligopeptide transport system substrate-binding protein